MTLTQPGAQGRGAGVGYGGSPVLNDVSMEVRPNEVLCVIGHNGAGKSTLMRALFGLVKPRSGRVLVDGETMPQHTPAAWRRRASP